MFADGDSTYEPGMKYPTKVDHPNDRETMGAQQRKYQTARNKFQRSGTSAARADKTQAMRDALARAEAAEAAGEE